MVILPKRESVYNNLYRKMDKDDRLSAGWTMEQYEHQYRQAFAKAAKAADPTWKAGKPIPEGALDGITRESVESGKKSVDIKNIGCFYAVYISFMQCWTLCA